MTARKAFKMASAVYEVDHETRLVLPDTTWSHMVLGKLISQGKAVIRVGGGDLVSKVESERSPEELARVDALVEGTGY